MGALLRFALDSIARRWHRSADPQTVVRTVAAVPGVERVEAVPVDKGRLTLRIRVEHGFDSRDVIERVALALREHTHLSEVTLLAERAPTIAQKSIATGASRKPHDEEA